MTLQIDWDKIPNALPEAGLYGDRESGKYWQEFRYLSYLMTHRDDPVLHQPDSALQLALFMAPLLAEPYWTQRIFTGNLQRTLYGGFDRLLEKAREFFTSVCPSTAVLNELYDAHYPEERLSDIVGAAVSELLELRRGCAAARANGTPVSALFHREQGAAAYHFTPAFEIAWQHVCLDNVYVQMLQDSGRRPYVARKLAQESKEGALADCLGKHDVDIHEGLHHYMSGMRGDARAVAEALSCSTGGVDRRKHNPTMNWGGLDHHLPRDARRLLRFSGLLDRADYYCGRPAHYDMCAGYLTLAYSALVAGAGLHFPEEAPRAFLRECARLESLAATPYIRMVLSLEADGWKDRGSNASRNIENVPSAHADTGVMLGFLAERLSDTDKRRAGDATTTMYLKRELDYFVTVSGREEDKPRYRLGT